MGSLRGAISKTERQLVDQVLSQIFDRRQWTGGWRHFTHAWSEVKAAAVADSQTPDSRWHEHFSAREMRSAQVTALAAAIDKFLLGGFVKDRCCRAGRALTCVVVDAGVQHHDWVAHFDPDNVVYVNRSRWTAPVSVTQPMNCEGVFCTSRLDILMHTLAHELVHAIVYNVLPEVDASCDAYLADDRHGPIFQYMNKHIFGHSSHAYETAHSTQTIRIDSTCYQ